MKHRMWYFLYYLILNFISEILHIRKSQTQNRKSQKIEKSSKEKMAKKSQKIVLFVEESFQNDTRNLISLGFKFVLYKHSSCACTYCHTLMFTFVIWHVTCVSTIYQCRNSYSHVTFDIQYFGNHQKPVDEKFEVSSKAGYLFMNRAAVDEEDKCEILKIF